MAEPRKARKRSPSQADRDPEIIAIKQLRDSIADKEAAGEACKGMYQCHKKADKACLDKIKATLTKLKAKSGGGKKKSKARGRSRTRSRSRSRK
jgi:hypothetical protein